MKEYRLGWDRIAFTGFLPNPSVPSSYQNNLPLDMFLIFRVSPAPLGSEDLAILPEQKKPAAVKINAATYDKNTTTKTRLSFKFKVETACLSWLRRSSAEQAEWQSSTSTHVNKDWITTAYTAVLLLVTVSDTPKSDFCGFVSQFMGSEIECLATLLCNKLPRFQVDLDLGWNFWFWYSRNCNWSKMEMRIRAVSCVIGWRYVKLAYLVILTCSTSCFCLGTPSLGCYIAGIMYNIAVLTRGQHSNFISWNERHPYIYTPSSILYDNR